MMYILVTLMLYAMVKCVKFKAVNMDFYMDFADKDASNIIFSIFQYCKHLCSKDKRKIPSMFVKNNFNC